MARQARGIPRFTFSGRVVRSASESPWSARPFSRTLVSRHWCGGSWPGITIRSASEGSVNDRGGEPEKSKFQRSEPEKPFAHSFRPSELRMERELKYTTQVHGRPDLRPIVSAKHREHVEPHHSCRDGRTPDRRPTLGGSRRSGPLGRRNKGIPSAGHAPTAGTSCGRKTSSPQRSPEKQEPSQSGALCARTSSLARTMLSSRSPRFVLLNAGFQGVRLKSRLRNRGGR